MNNIEKLDKSQDTTGVQALVNPGPNYISLLQPQPKVFAGMKTGVQ